jgi:hypothetical protein
MLASGGGGGETGTGTASTSTPATPNNYMSPGDLNQALQSIREKMPDLMANTGGALSPSSAGNVAGTESGLAGEQGIMQQAIQSFLGQGQGDSGGTFDIKKSTSQINPSAPGFTLQKPFG